MTSTRIAELAARIQKNTLKVDEYMRLNGLPSPTFDEDGPVDFKIHSREVQEARVIAIDSTLELHQLLLGPALCLRPVVRMKQERARCYGSSLLFSSLLSSPLLSLIHLFEVERYKSPSHLQIRYCFQSAHPWRGVF